MKIFQPIKIYIVPVLLIAVLLAGCSSSDTPEVDWEVAIGGEVDTPKTFTFQELADMPQTELEDVLMQKKTGDDVLTSWSGVALEDVFSEVGAGEFGAITATASDGYAVVIDRADLSDAIIALKDDGEWIAEVDPEMGPVRLVVPDLPGSKWIFQLVEIQVNP